MTEPEPEAEPKPRFTVIVPARRGAVRLPDKPLADLEGQPMVVRVAERAQQSGAEHVLVATDDEAIVAACRAAGVEAIMTRADHASGTERLAEAAAWLELADESIVVNLQGDEPLMPPGLIARAAAELVRASDCVIATACHTIDKEADWSDPNVVKVVFDHARRALYFSRAPIPFERDRTAGAPPQQAFRHIGIYAYRAGFLARFARLEASPLEALEKLEQLRALWHGYRIAVFEAGEAPEAGVDTAADLERVRAVMAARNALVTAAR